MMRRAQRIAAAGVVATVGFLATGVAAHADLIKEEVFYSGTPTGTQCVFVHVSTAQGTQIVPPTKVCVPL